MLMIRQEPANGEQPELRRTKTVMNDTEVADNKTSNIAYIERERHETNLAISGTDVQRPSVSLDSGLPRISSLLLT
jgi:hypothetical protein